MNGLLAYGSDSDAEEKNTMALSSKRTRSLTPSDDESGPVDVSDAFGLRSAHGNEAWSAGDTENWQTSEGGEESKNSGPKPVSVGTNLVVRTAPDIVTEDTALHRSLLTRPSDTEMFVNIPYSEMSRPTAGPSNPFSTRKLGAQQNSLSGHFESTVINEFDFRNQERTFENLGYAKNPTLYTNGGVPGKAWVGNLESARAHGFDSALETRSASGSAAQKKAAKQLKMQRTGQRGDPGVTEGEGAYMGPWGGWQGESVNLKGVGPSEDEIRHAQESSTDRKKEKQAMEERRAREEEQGTEKSVFHGKSMYDYQGRSYLHVPGDVETNLHGESGKQTCFVPKACIHTWTGHTKAVSVVRLFPKSGHLLLSASMDTKVKLWDIYHEGNCLRTFMGHSKAVRDITFSNDGRCFLSAGYDRQMKLWDTETGQCIRAYSNGKVPYVVRFHPDGNKQDVFLAGMSDKKIVQFDTNTGEVTQEYDQHLGPVNTITFVDENRRFVTTSDDKTMRAWDYDIPVVIKYVADPLMYSMPAVTVHPNKKWLAAQSLDNSIVVYSTDSLRQNRKRIFKGHSVAGYACEVGFSPDGRFLSSGDGEGSIVFWDWKTSRLIKKIRAHKEVVISHVWLPHETSKVVTGSWDGTIKLWD